MADDDERVRGMGADAAAAEAGAKLFKAETEFEVDTAGATKFKDEMDVKLAKLDEEIAGLGGKDNKKARTEKEKEKKAMKDQKDYIDACKVVSGKPAQNGFFMKAKGPSAEELAKEKEAAEAKAAAEQKAKEEAEAKDAKKSDKPKKEQESAGISKAERDELEKLKNDIIAKKKSLKEAGMSGGQMNKDEEIVVWVKRMNDLKEKENPGAAQAQKDEKKGAAKKGKKLDSATMEKLMALEKEYEEYLEKLRDEFKYSKKEIAGDPDRKDMEAEINKLKK